METDKGSYAPVSDTARKILESFDRTGLTRLGAADLIAAAGSDAAAETALAGLVEAGYLRENLGQYERSEAGRLEVAGPLDLTVLSRSRCHLCEEALRQVEPLVPRFGARLRVVDIDSDAVLRERYNTEVPVIFLGRRELAHHSADARQIQEELSRASAQKK